ncbi:MAG TPA: hypothetical protein VNE21_07030 [Mycobacteriales bacterium]|nr:hypothetical protein [Mycobacteriales bacterium]
MRQRALDYPGGTPVERLGPAALVNVVTRGDLADWAPLLHEVAADPHGQLAETLLALCRALDGDDAAALWRLWIDRRRSSAGSSLAGLRRRRGSTQASVGAAMGLQQSDVSKLERRPDVLVSTLRAYVQAVGARLRLSAIVDGEAIDLEIGG